MFATLSACVRGERASVVAAEAANADADDESSEYSSDGDDE
jgi:hypothetical protein